MDASCIAAASKGSGEELCFTVSQKGRWLQRKKSLEVSSSRTIPIHRISGVYPVTQHQEHDGKQQQVYHSCILAIAPETSVGNSPISDTSFGYLMGLRFTQERDLLLWAAALKEAMAAPIGSSKYKNKLM